MRHERTSRRAACRAVQYGSFHLNVSAGIHEVAYMLDNSRTRFKCVANLRIDYQIHISLSVSQLGVFEAVEFLRQRQQRLAQERYLVRFYCYLSCIRAEDLALYAYNVAYIIRFVCLIRLFSHYVLAGVALYLTFGVQHVEEACFSHYALAHDSARDSLNAAFQVFKVVKNLLGCRRAVKLHYIKRIIARFAHSRKLLAAQPANLGYILCLFLLLLLAVLIVIVCHIFSLCI